MKIKFNPIRNAIPAGLFYTGFMFCLIFHPGFHSSGLAAEFQDFTILSPHRTYLGTAVNKDGLLCLVYTADKASYGSIRARYYKDGVWSDPEVVRSSPDLGLQEPTICAGPRGEFHMVWYEGGSFWYCRREPDTGWTEPEHIATKGGGEYRLVCDPFGYLYLFFGEYFGSAYDSLYFKFFDGVYWAPEVKVVTASSIGFDYCEAAPDMFGGAHCVATGSINAYYIKVHPDLTFETHEHGYIRKITMDRDNLNRIHLIFLPWSDQYYGLMYAMFPAPFWNISGAVPIDYDPVPDILFEAGLSVSTDAYFQVHGQWQQVTEDADDNRSYSLTIKSISPFHNTPEELYPCIRWGTSTIENVSDGETLTFFNVEYGEDDIRMVSGRKPRDLPGVRIDVPSSIIRSGSRFTLNVHLSNPALATVDAEAVICVMADGECFFYPGWGNTLTSTPVHMESGFSETWIILDAEMPEFTHESGPYQIYAALIDPEDQSLVGDPSGHAFKLIP